MDEANDLKDLGVKTPNEILADRIVSALISEGLISQDAQVKTLERLSSGSFTATDWIQLLEGKGP